MAVAVAVAVAVTVAVVLVILVVVEVAVIVVINSSISSKDSEKNRQRRSNWNFPGGCSVISEDSDARRPRFIYVEYHRISEYESIFFERPQSSLVGHCIQDSPVVQFARWNSGHYHYHYHHHHYHYAYHYAYHYHYHYHYHHRYHHFIIISIIIIIIIVSLSLSVSRSFGRSVGRSAAVEGEMCFLIEIYQDSNPKVITQIIALIQYSVLRDTAISLLFPDHRILRDSPFFSLRALTSSARRGFGLVVAGVPGLDIGSKLKLKQKLKLGGYYLYLSELFVELV